MTSTEVTTAEDTSLLNLIARAARDPTVDIAKLEALLAMQERVAAHDAKRRYTEALSAVAQELAPVGRDARNPHIGNRYATLAAIDAALRPIYTRHGFSVRYGTAPAAPGEVRVTCTVGHISGHSETGELAAELDATGTSGRTSKIGVQAIGSTVTYLRRYLLAMAFNVQFFEDDDDGEAVRKAMRGNQKPIRPPSAAPRPQAELNSGNGKGPAQQELWFQEREAQFAEAKDEVAINTIVGYWLPAVQKMDSEQVARWSTLVDAARARIANPDLWQS